MTEPAPAFAVLVVGAGPTGLALAAQLAAHGVRARIIDRNRERTNESRALAIQPRTLEVLAGLGVSDELVRLGNPDVLLRVHVRGRELATPLFDRGLADTAYPFLLFLSQAETERVLTEHLAARGVRVERGVELLAIESAGDGVVCRLRHDGGAEESAEVAYVVGCDGAHSSVRQLAGIPFAGGSYPQTFVLADVEADDLQAGSAHVFLSSAGMLFLFPLLHPASWRLLAMCPKNDPTVRSDGVALADLQVLADAYTGGSVRLRDPVWMTNFRLHHRAAARYRSGRMFLAGDAAHIHSPAGAQGMNTGIQDAINLGWKLAHVLRGADPRLLDTYETERAPIGAAVLRMSDRAFAIATATNPLAAAARTRLAPFAIPLAFKASAGRAYLFRTLAQLRVRYRRSPLSVHGRGAMGRGPRPGDRVPDGATVRNGVRTTLHSVLAAPGWHLLVSTPPADVEVVARRYSRWLTLHHISGEDLTLLGLKANDRLVLLVRPDGHVGYRATAFDAAELGHYLRQWLPRPNNVDAVPTLPPPD